MKDKYVLDSSIWIDLERRHKKVSDRVLPLIEKNRVCLVDVILAEVVRGVKTRKDYHRLRNAFSFFNQLSTKWDVVAELAFNVAKHGFHPPLIDLYIAQCVRENKKILITKDKDFQSISQVSAFQYEIL